MDLTSLATRKRIKNSNISLPKFSNGFETDDWLDNPLLSGIPGRVMPLTGALSVLPPKPPKLNPGEAVIKNAPSGKDLMTAGASKTKPSGNSKSSVASKLGGIVDNALQIGTAGLTFAGALHNSALTSITPDEMIRNGGSGLVDGMSYDIQSTDSTDAMERASQERTQGVLGAMGAGAGFGGAVGSVAGPLGGAIGTAAGGIVGLVGGLFGSSSAKRKAEAARREAERRTIAHNEYGYDMALTLSLRNKEALRYGGSDSQMLYAASLGLEDVSGLNNFVFTKKNVFTPVGVTKGGIANANVEKGEKLVENMGGGRYNVLNVTEGPDDTAFAMLSNNTSVMSAREKNPETGNTYAEDTEDYIKQGRLPELLASQAITRELKNTKNMINYKKNMYFAKNKFLPGLAKGWENLAVNGLGFITSLADYGMHKSQDVFNPDINPTNKYEGRVVDLMSGRRANAYPVILNLFENEAGERFRMNNSSALSAGQRTLANIANTFNTRLGRMNALLNVQNMNNEFAKDAATMLNLMGTTGMNAKLQSDQFNAQALASSSAKKADLMMNDKRNMLDYATQFAKNNWERDQFDRMMELYWLLVKNDAVAAGKKDNALNTPVSNTVAPIKNVTLLKDYDPNSRSILKMWTDLNLTLKDVYNLYLTLLLPSHTTKKINNNISRNTNSAVFTAPQLTVRRTKKNNKAVATNSKSLVDNSPVPSEPLIMRPQEYSYVPVSVSNMVEANRNAVLGNLSNVDVKIKKNKSRTSPKTNREALSNLFDYMRLGAAEYKRRYGR